MPKYIPRKSEKHFYNQSTVKAIFYCLIHVKCDQFSTLNKHYHLPLRNLINLNFSPTVLVSSQANDNNF